MASGYPDWLRAVALIGKDPDGNLVLIRVDADGQLTVPFKAENPTGDLVTVAVDASGQLYAIMRGASGEDLFVDASGYLTAVLKGDYAGALRTIGLDDEGRITAYMVDDESQWGNIVKTGNAELAVRLGAPTAWDWRGQVQLVTDFRNGLGGAYADGRGVGWSVTLDPSFFLSNGYSVKLVSGSDGLRKAYLGVGVEIPATDRIGFYIRWLSDTDFSYLYLYITVSDGARFYQGAIRFDRANDSLDYLDTVQAWQSFATQKYSLDGEVWHGLKLVIDKSVGEYLRTLAGRTEHDMSGIEMYNYAGVGPQWVKCRIELTGRSGYNDCAWIDALVVTTSEPE